MNAIYEQMIHTWSTGGPVMFALFALGIVMYGTAAHLLIKLYHRGLTRVTDDKLRRWVSEPAESPQNIRELVRYTQDEVHSLQEIEGRFREVEAAKVPDVDRRIAFLNVIVVSAPLFGLLGTVGGMLLTFKAIGVGGSSTSDIIAKGISEALIATQTGMMVAIPGFMMAHVAKRWRNEYVSFLARLEGVTLRYFRREFPGMTRVFTRPAATKGRPSTVNTQPVAA
ncbi:MAG TPA: MotA/TolQ/ExbB proton channel family protein [Methylomirabilota bacterium]|nr:MotA/TolQ/ExbB proton channel family protein [Methylomirabilota bacterium]